MTPMCMYTVILYARVYSHSFFGLWGWGRGGLYLCHFSDDFGSDICKTYKYSSTNNYVVILYTVCFPHKF